MIVSDAGPIIAFARANLLDLLGRVVVELGIPDAVHAELTVGGGARAEDVIQAKWIKRVSIPVGSEAEIMPRRLGKGEREAIVLAQFLGLPLLADDAAARREALSRRLVVVGSLGVLREAALLGLISGVREPLDRLRETGFWISQDLYERFLRAVC